MHRRLRLIATVVATTALVAASVATVSARTLTTLPTFSVFLNGASSEGDQVIVTRQLTWKSASPDETCVKDVDPDHCNGSAHDYSRLYAGAPWVIDDIP